jgi:hypothetical protein
MENQILSFIHGLRRAEIPVTTGETLDALRAATEIPLADRSQFRDALRTTLVKRVELRPEFERLFDLYFSHLQEGGAGAGGSDPGLAGGFVPVPEMEAVRALMGSSLSPLSRALMGGEGVALEHMAMGAAGEAGVSEIQYPLQVGAFARRVGERMGMARTEEELAQALEMLRREGLSPEALGRAEAALRRNREALQGLLKRLVKRELDKGLKATRQRLAEDGLVGKSFSSLTDQEIEEMRDLVGRLVRRLRTKIALLERRRRRGRLDVRRTLRRNLQYGGVPMELLFKERKRKKTQVMALCDVSSSVWNASRFMLNLLYAIQDQFARVRSFVFVSDLGEVTALFDRWETNEAIRRALREAGIRYHAYSDYGDVLLRFHGEHLRDVTTRTVVIIIGDGRNNYLPTRAWALQEIKERARRVYWLNPELRTMWNQGDSVMHEYAPHCTDVRECRNLKQLGAFIDELVV